MLLVRLSRRWILLALAVFAGGTGCATKVSIRTLKPGRISLGAVQQLVLFDGEGRRSAREVVAQEFLRETRSRGYFTTEDRSEADVVIRLAGRRAVIEGAGGTLSNGQAGVRIDVLDWTSGRDIDEVWEKDEEGNRIKVEIAVHRGTALLAVSIFDSDGQAYLAETEYVGDVTDDLDTPREQLLDHAARDAVAQLLDDITPVPVVSRVRLDDDDPGQEMILEAAKAGNISQAAADAERYLERNPMNAPAAYNLAVFLEALGRFEAALASYDNALSLGNKAFYVRARAACARRLQETRELAPRA